MPMELPLLIPVELKIIDFATDNNQYGTLGLEPRTSTLQHLRKFARMYRPA